MFTYRVFFRRFRLSVIRRPAFQQRYNIFPSLWLIHRKKKSHLERRLFLTTSSAQLPSSLLLVRLVFKGYLNIKKNHIKYILLLWNAHAHKNTSSSHCIVLNHYYCCIYIYILILISIIYNNIIITLPPPPPRPPPPWDGHQMRILKYNWEI